MPCLIKVLIEDTGSGHGALKSEHGLSLYVETPESKFVFDCGASGQAWENAKFLNVKLSQINYAVISHSHYDHAGGFRALMQYAKPKTLYTGKDFWLEKFEHENNKYTYLGAGFDQSDLAEWGVENVLFNSNILQLDNYAWLAGNFKRKFDFETIPPEFVIRRGFKNYERDNFNDEISLVLRENDGVAIITGCAHPGILNIVKSIHENLKLKVKSVIGGTHLKHASPERIDKTLSMLKDMGLERMGLCHCSGELVRDRLKDFKATGCLLSTGDLIEF